jgi:hypothetical protein
MLEFIRSSIGIFKYLYFLYFGNGNFFTENLTKYY